MKTRFDFALEFAKAAHGSQVRKYTGEPYWHHVLAVADTVATVPGHTTEMLQAALLHDVLEDTEESAEAIEFGFGPLVRAYVEALTDPPLSFGNRAARKAAVRDRMLTAPWAVKTIKLADLLDNTASIVARDKDFAKVYLVEKSALLGSLLGGDQVLWNRARASCDDAMAA